MAQNRRNLPYPLCIPYFVYLIFNIFNICIGSTIMCCCTVINLFGMQRFFSHLLALPLIALFQPCFCHFFRANIAGKSPMRLAAPKDSASKRLSLPLLLPEKQRKHSSQVSMQFSFHRSKTEAGP